MVSGEAINAALVTTGSTVFLGLRDFFLDLDDFNGCSTIVGSLLCGLMAKKYLVNFVISDVGKTY